MKAKHKETLARMGVTEAVLARVRAAESQDEGERRLEEAKATCKKGFRALALEMHPDVGGDPEEFRFVKSVYEGFMEAKYKGWRKRSRTAQTHTTDSFFYGANPFEDPLMANFRRMKREQEERRRQETRETLEELLRRMNRGQYAPPPPRQPRRRSKPNAPPPRKEHKGQQEFYLAEHRGVWRKILSQTLPHPDAPKRRK